MYVFSFLSYICLLPYLEIGVFLYQAYLKSTSSLIFLLDVA